MGNYCPTGHLLLQGGRSTPAPIHSLPPDALISEAQVSPDSTINTFPPTIKAGKAPTVCGIYPEYIQHGGSDALRTLHKIVTQIWKEEVVPEEWHQGIIILLYKGKGSTSYSQSIL